MATTVRTPGRVRAARSTPRESLERLRSRVQEDAEFLQRSSAIPLSLVHHVHQFGRLSDVKASISIDHNLAGELWQAASEAESALEITDAGTRRLELRFALEEMLDVLDSLLESEPFGDSVPIADVLKRTEALLQAPQHDLAEILGVSVRTLQRWISGEGEPGPGLTDRVRIVGQLVNQLRHFLTPSGIVSWFRREHPRFGQPPLELLDAPATYPDLLDAASAPRSMPL